MGLPIPSPCVRRGGTVKTVPYEMSVFPLERMNSMDVLEWLLEPCDPSVRYRTLAQLVDKGGTEEALEAQRLIADSTPVKRLLNAMHPDGYWLQKNPRTGVMIGDDAPYGSFGTTHFCLSYCAELGMTRDHPQIENAASRYLGLQKDDGDWWHHISCMYTYNIRAFVLLGYRDDERVQKTVDLMLNTVRQDGGYLCDMHEKPKRKPPKSCVRGAVKALLAFSELPEYWQHERCLRLVDYFLNRNGIFRNNDHTRFVNDDMKSDSFPIIWRANLWEILYALSKMGYGRDKRLKDAWDVMESRKDSAGRYALAWTPAQCPWKVGKVGEPNKWVTLYCLLAEKYRQGCLS